MTNMPFDLEQRYREMLLKPSGAERLKIGCSMHATAKALVLALLLEKRPDATPVELRQELFLRFYGTEFDQKTQHKILAALRSPSQLVTRDLMMLHS